jgi:neutral ceramidase
VRRRLHLRVLLAFVALFAVVGAGLVTPVDERPYDAWDTYRQTMGELNEEGLRAARGFLEAGFGKASLTPRLDGSAPDWRTGVFPDLPLAGFSERRGASATGVHDPLWVKTIALRVRGQTVVLTSLDMLIVPPSVSELVAARLPSAGLSRDQLYLSATHTHSGPGGWGKDWVTRLVAGPYHEGVERWIAQQALISIEAALENLRPASMGEAWVNIPDLVKAKKEGESHPGFPLLLFRQIDGREAVLGAYAAHPLFLSSDNRQLSGDYPGAWQRAMEERGFDLAMFMAGPMGGQSATDSGNTFLAAESFGRRLADRVGQAASNVEYRRSTKLAALGLEVVLPDPQIRLTEDWRIRPWAARSLLPLKENTFLQAIRVGRTILLSTPADYAGELAIRLEEEVRDLDVNLAVTSFNGDYIGYIMPSKYYHSGMYETRVMSFYGPEMGEFTKEVLAQMARVLTNARDDTS